MLLQVVVSSKMTPINITAKVNMSDENCHSLELVKIDLAAAIIAIRDFEPKILLADYKTNREKSKKIEQNIKNLPYGRFRPAKHRKMATGLRQLVKQKAGFSIGYVEQLYSFGDNKNSSFDDEVSSISIGYLALTRPEKINQISMWYSWYEFFPWEDWREGVPEILTKIIYPLLEKTAKEKFATEQNSLRGSWKQRMIQFFAINDKNNWDPERVLERYELLYEAGMVQEALADKQEIALIRKKTMNDDGSFELGTKLVLDHRRILATAMSRLRAKIKYRPVIFDLMTEKFTLYTLQRVVEAIYGKKLHKQNFRRHLTKSKLLEPTHEIMAQTGGRPAKLYRFRHYLYIEWEPIGLLPPNRY